MESNPGSVSDAKAATLRDGGVNRISLGVQSWDDTLLGLLGREHNAKQAEQSYRIYQDAGFRNIALDLMFALPGQTETQWRRTLATTLALRPQHISAYCLTYEEETNFFARMQCGEFRVCDETEARFLEIAISMLQSEGYEQYEISNYALPGFRSQHNQAYWRGADYIGLGPSAFSTFRNERWQNIADHREYERRLRQAESPIATCEKLSPAMKRTEQIALGLRTSEGIERQAVNPEEVPNMISAGLVKSENDRLLLTGRGKLLVDSVAENLL